MRKNTLCTRIKTGMFPSAGSVGGRVWGREGYKRPASFQSVNTSYLRENTWCDVVKEGYSHQYNFMRIMLKDFIHIHNVTLFFNLPLINYLYLGTTLLSYIQQITIHFLWPHTHNCIPDSFYFE